MNGNGIERVVAVRVARCLTKQIIRELEPVGMIEDALKAAELLGHLDRALREAVGDERSVIRG